MSKLINNSLLVNYSFCVFVILVCDLGSVVVLHERNYIIFLRGIEMQY